MCYLGILYSLLAGRGLQVNTLGQSPSKHGQRILIIYYSPQAQTSACGRSCGRRSRRRRCSPLPGWRSRPPSEAKSARRAAVARHGHGEPIGGCPVRELPVGVPRDGEAPHLRDEPRPHGPSQPGADGGAEERAPRPSKVHRAPSGPWRRGSAVLGRERHPQAGAQEPDERAAGRQARAGPEVGGLRVEQRVLGPQVAALSSPHTGVKGNVPTSQIVKCDRPRPSHDEICLFARKATLVFEASALIC
jgi:hypothetical protein